ncbi:hypothetical protein [Streptomyces sp. NRRL S-1448]|uniref:hypothetical protein n=1 Tax=Streptomyces sp. NRRL S-1448 TaxID=1463883 RepID=UPI00131E39AD|nr:hypothetical protein [Streptomyces sp. NRRL S-1448]
MAVALLAALIGLRMIKGAAVLLHDLARAAGADSAARAAKHFLWLLRPEVANQPARGWGSLVFVIVVSIPLLVPMWWLVERRMARGAIFRYRATIRALDALSLCAAAYRQPSGDRASQLRDLDRGLRDVEDAILRSHRYAGTIPRNSVRRAATRSHAALVAGALRAEVLKIDAEPDDALPRLGAILVTIAERSAEGRIGALLPEAALAEATPVSATRTALRESAHVAVVIIAAMTAAVGASSVLPSLGVNHDLRPWLIVGCSVLAAILVGGWHRVGRLLELVPGK